MSTKRQLHADASRADSEAAQPILRSLSMHVAPGHKISTHAHPWPQLIYASVGTLRITAAQRRWTTVPGSAAWIPAHLDHAVYSLTPTCLDTLYLSPQLAESLPTTCRVLRVSMLLHALILHVTKTSTPLQPSPDNTPVAELLKTQIRDAQAAVDGLVLPTDPRAAKIARRILNSPATHDPLDVIIAGAGASKRTLERLFLAQTGQTIGAWRTSARLNAALEQIDTNRSIAEIASNSGYKSTSAFVAAFRHRFGMPPAAYRAAEKPLANQESHQH